MTILSSNPLPPSNPTPTDPPADPNSLFGRFAKKAGRQFPGFRPKPRRELSRQIVKTTTWDRVDWAEARRDSEINDAITDLYLGDLNNPDERPGYLNAPELVQDIFMTFLKPVPVLHKKSDVKKDAKLNGKFIEQLMNLNDWERLHDQTLTDPMLSRLATTVVIEALQGMIKEHREAVKRANEDRAEDDGPCGPQGPGRKPEEKWETETEPKPPKPKPGDGPTPPGGHTPDDGAPEQEDEDEPGEPGEGNAPLNETEQEMRDRIKQELEDERAEQAENEGDEPAEQSEDEESEDESEDDVNPLISEEEEREFNVDWEEQEAQEETDWEKQFGKIDFGRHVNTAVRKAADNIEDIEEVRKAAGLDDAEWKAMDPAARMKMAERLNTPQMRDIADRVGRTKRFALGKQATKVIDAPHEIYNVEMGNDIRRVLRSEFVHLGNPATKAEFYRKFLNRELLQYKERGHENVGKGPMILCIDNSGSMSGDPENWAKGVAEAMRRICADQDRDFEAIFFEVNRHRQRFSFPKGKGPFEKVLSFLSVTAGGGTEFDGVLTEALGKAATVFDSDGKGKADIVFITDGQARLDKPWIDKFVAERDRVGVRIFGIYVSAYDSSRGPAVKLLESFCQTVVPVKELQANDVSTDALFSVL